MKYTIGIDESGCGALIGPLVVCAVAFAEGTSRVSVVWKGVHRDKTLQAGDSKGIKNPAHRDALAIAVRTSCASIMTVERTAAEIDQRLLGTVFPETIKLAAVRCLEQLKTFDPSVTAEDISILIDGDVPKPDLPCSVRCIPDGDKTDWRIGAASIVARVVCDQRIDAIHAEYPRWNFDKSRGYPTAEHKTFLTQRGPLPVHRKTFAPVRNAMPRAVGIED